MPIAGAPYMEELLSRWSVHGYKHRWSCRCIERWKRTKRARSLRAQYAALCRWERMR